MTHTPDPRKVIVCPGCGKRLASVRRRWYVMHSLLTYYDNVTAAKTEFNRIVLSCKCGTTTTVHWAAIQF
jgi:hypothetical protein